MTGHRPEAKGPVVCIIPGRGGSKRVPGKNLLPLAGRPLIAHSIQHAKLSQCIDEVFVSTDDQEIASVSEKYGATVIERPPSLSADTATSESALAHALEWRSVLGMEEAGAVIFLQCTSPIRKPDDIDRAFAQFEKEKLDSLFSATPNSRFIWGLQPDGQPISINYDYNARQREQDMETQFRENGSIYIFRPHVLHEFGNRLGGKFEIFQMDYWTSFQLDDPEHVELLEIASLKDDYRINWPSPEKTNLVVFDFDGVMTDNTVWVGEDGREMVRCNRSDGLGIGLLKEAGISAMILSTEKNPVVVARASKLDIPCVQGVGDKGAFLKKYLEQQNVAPGTVAYVGNDINDLGCFDVAGYSMAASDALPEVLAKADHILRASGGFGAVREACDWLVLNNNKKN